ncbi:hypothetical protein V6N12_047964 [Hibiscus sabdariffa]|uniref:Uncharacterized protein n=1 Tax=Hibiscus sabdariffa TaxID=183260 RepID=A0ABR2CUH6_9ROSI
MGKTYRKNQERIPGSVSEKAHSTHCREKILILLETGMTFGSLEIQTGREKQGKCSPDVIDDGLRIHAYNNALPLIYSAKTSFQARHQARIRQVPGFLVEGKRKTKKRLDEQRIINYVDSNGKRTSKLMNISPLFTRVSNLPTARQSH